MGVGRRFRDSFAAQTPWWLSWRPAEGFTVGYRYLWGSIAIFDQLMQVAFDGLTAWFPGLAQSDALPLIGQSRGILRAEGETDADQATRLRAWLDTWRAAGSAEGLAGVLHTYLGNHPRIRIITRSGIWVTLDEDGTITKTSAAWDWDSLSNPERAGAWWDLWIVVYPDEWTRAPAILDPAFDASAGIGHLLTSSTYDTIAALLRDWKSAHTNIRCVIWTSDTTAFDPANPSSLLPDGWWGRWGKGGANLVPSRDTTVCRYWEPTL